MNLYRSIRAEQSIGERTLHTSDTIIDIMHKLHYPKSLYPMNIWTLYVTENEAHWQRFKRVSLDLVDADYYLKTVWVYKFQIRKTNHVKAINARP